MREDESPRVSKRAELAALVFAVILPTLVTLLYFVVVAALDERVQQATYGAGKTFQFAFPLIWVLLVCREGVRFRPPHGRSIAVGFVFGLSVFAAIMGLYHLWLKPAGFFDLPSKAVGEKVVGLGLDSPLRYAATGLFYALVHSFLEEYYWRWFVFGRLERQMTLGLAVAISSLGFMLHHVLLLAIYFGWSSPATYLLSVCVAIGGAAWALQYHYWRSLSGPWISHLLVDAAIFLLGYDLLRDML